MNNLHSSTIVMYDVLRLKLLILDIKLEPWTFSYPLPRFSIPPPILGDLKFQRSPPWWALFERPVDRSVDKQTMPKPKNEETMGTRSRSQSSHHCSLWNSGPTLWTALWTPSTGSFPRSLWGTKTRRKISQKRRVWLTSFATSNLKYVSI